MTSPEFRDLLEERAALIGLGIAVPAIPRLEAYFRLLATWNAKLNLTALPLAPPSVEAIDRLLIEPLIAARELPESATSLVDIGSGGGSPAIPLAVGAPSPVRLLMVESRQRKAVFLREALRATGIAGDVAVTRYEELLEQPAMREAHDAVSVRAVRLDAATIAGLGTLLRPDGRLFLFRPRTDEPAPSPFISTQRLALPSPSSELAILRKN